MGVVSPAGHSQYFPHFVESLRECETLKISSQPQRSRPVSDGICAGSAAYLTASGLHVSSASCGKAPLPHTPLRQCGPYVCPSA